MPGNELMLKMQIRNGVVTIPVVSGHASQPWTGRHGKIPEGGGKTGKNDGEEGRGKKTQSD